MHGSARLLFPALRWQDDGGFDHERATIELSLRMGVGGFIIFGGTADDVRALTTMLQRESAHALLIASDVERGAGQQFAGATALPPPAAIGALNDIEVTRRAGAVTAGEALAIGVNWLFAPVADVDLEPANPIVGTRAFGTLPESVAEHVVAWIEGAHARGALCCAKHFPGHGRTLEDSHSALPRVRAGRQLLEEDLAPFRAAVRAGVDSVMTAHVIYDALDAATPATLSPAVLRDLLRGVLAFDGIVVSDSLTMTGVLAAADGDEGRAAVHAINAGCDALLYPADLQRVATAIERARGSTIAAERFDQALARIGAAAQRVQRAPAAAASAGVQAAPGATSPEDRVWSDDIAERSCTICRGAPGAGAGAVDVLTIDDETGASWAARDRTAFTAALQDAHGAVRVVDTAAADSALIIAVHAGVRAARTGAGLSDRALTQLRRALDTVPDAGVVVFGHPRLAEQVPARHVLAAWGGDPIMQRAAARRLLPADR